MSQRLLKSVNFAFRGLKKVWRTEKNFRIHVLIATLVMLGAFFIGLTSFDYLILLLTITLVLTLEIINSGIERLVDMLAPATHHFVKEIKDLFAAVVLLSSILAVIVGLLVFGPYFF